MLARWRFERALSQLAQTDIPVLADFASADWPEPATPVREAPLLALDFELDGLTRDAHLLQAGWVPFSGRAIAMADAQVHDIRSHAELNRVAVTVHGIGTDRASEGTRPRDVITQLVKALSGRILVAHAAGIERSALQRMTQTLFGHSLPIRSICTLELERRLAPNLIGDGVYRLGACRARYGLPEYAAHDALTDALAAAELLQAQLSRMAADMSLGSLERYI
ncbi:exonuclease domain-containing protein [Altererythrobacter sp. GH1-8]|uniref:exonuclease domain-containing protein n=1 Tax=Altererythrobacter sp. GH1-8 TaxID=3349333 RepID=UPI00374D8A96